MSNYPIVPSQSHGIAIHRSTGLSTDADAPIAAHAVRPLLGQVTCLDYASGKLAAAGDRVACVWSARTHALQTRVVAANRIAAISLSQDGLWLAVATGRQLQVHHQPTGQLAFTYDHSALVTSVHIASNAPIVASGDAQGRAQVWGVVNGEMHREMRHPPGPLTVFLNYDASILVLESPDNNILIDLKTGQPLRTFVNTDAPESEASVSPLHTPLVAFSGSMLRFYDCARRGAHSMRAHDLGASITSIDICDDTQTALASTRAGRIHLFRLRTGEPAGSMDAFTIPLLAARFGPRDTVYAAGGEPLVMQLTCEQHVHSLLDEVVPIVAVAHSATYRALLVSDRDGGVTHYDLCTGRRSNAFTGHAGSVSAVVCDEGHIASAAYDGTARVWRWDGPLEAEFRSGHGPIQALALDTARGALWTGDWEGFVNCFDIRTGAAMTTLRERALAIRSLNLDARQQRLLIGDNEGQFTVRDLTASNTVLGLWHQPGAVYRGVIDADGSLLTTADDGVRRYVIGADDPIHIYHGETIRWFTLHDGKLYTLSLSGAIKVFDVATRECIRQVQLDSPCPHRALHVIGSNRIVAGSGDGRVQVFDAQLKLVATLQHLREGVLWTTPTEGSHPGWIYTDRPTLVEVGGLRDGVLHPWSTNDPRRARHLAVFNSASHVMQAVTATTPESEATPLKRAGLSAIASPLRRLTGTVKLTGYQNQ